MCSKFISWTRIRRQDQRRKDDPSPSGSRVSRLVPPRLAIELHHLEPIALGEQVGTVLIDQRADLGGEVGSVGI